METKAEGDSQKTSPTVHTPEGSMEEQALD